MKFLVKIDLEFDLKFEISDGKNLVKFGGRTFLPARKARNISEQISEKISETSFQISQLFFGNFVQQKGGANKLGDARGAREVRRGTSSIDFHIVWSLSGTGDSQRDSRESIRANHSQLKPLFLKRVRPIR